MADWPRTVKRGPLKGRTFDTAEEYEQAKAELASDAGGGDDSTPATPERQRRARGSSAKVNAKMAEAIVSMANMALAVVPQTRADVLDEDEQKALIVAIVDTAAVNPYFARMILWLTNASSSGELAMVGAAIVARRLARHEVNLPFVGVLPPSFDQQAGMLLWGIGHKKEVEQMAASFGFSGQPPAPPDEPGYPNGVVGFPPVGVG